MSQESPVARGGVLRIDNRQLAPIAVVAQCLDNQWVSQDLLKDMINRRLSYRDVERRRRQDARAEYLRSILNAQQVVVNRAFFFNNPVVYRDFLEPGPQREAFRELLSESVLVPFLLREQSPAEQPSFTLDPVGWSAWSRLLTEVDAIRCLRLSWDDDENAEYVEEYLVRTFHNFLLGLHTCNLGALQRDLRLDPESLPVLRQRVRDVVRWASDTERADRESFYRTFLTATADPAEGKFDSRTPLVAELKQLVDLRYNTTLPDAVDRFALIPTDSLRRSALQEFPTRLTRDQGGAGTRERTMEQFVEMLRVLRPSAFDLAQLPLRIDFTGLELHHVRQARDTDEWRDYVTSLRALIDDPDDFLARGQAVYDRYVALAGRLAGIVGERRQAQMEVWDPVINVTVEVLGATASIIFDGDPRVELIGEVGTGVGARGVRAVVRFLVVGRDQRRAENELSAGIHFMQIRLERGRDEWRELIRRLHEAGFPVVDGNQQRDPEASMEQPPEDDHGR